MRAAIALLPVLAAAACAGPAPVEPDVHSELDSIFTLRPGQDADIEGTDLRVRFVEVPADSRCPVDVTCVWAGDAQVHLVIEKADGLERPLDLHTTLDPRAADVDAYRISLLRLEPRPKTGEVIPDERYEASFEVSRIP